MDEFEKWAKRNRLDVTRNQRGEGYYLMKTQLFLECWQAAQQGVQSDVLVTCANCGVYHSIYLPCPSDTAQAARR